ncbi:MAG: hypothetical protein ACYCXN_06885 [Acidimicrobiales bacterium]
MAELVVEGDEVVLRLSEAEKIEAVHGDLRAPLSSVRGVEVLDDAHRPADLAGFRIGARIPGFVEVATVTRANKKIFAAVHHGTPRGVRVRLEGTSWDEWIVGCAAPEAVAASLQREG